ncbi:extracellular matrix protein 1 [Neoarius graeffei]|uniref:extracellular matrix protein 1 n=1 Tax=Neoarius graeffei TaxID=443677 RepID=UPI00298C8882|nr:extracellular matrix protein 1 [Neoarius graeffei]
MASVRGHLLLLMLLAVKGSEDYDPLLQREVLPPDFESMLQRPVYPTELLDMMKQASLVPHPPVRPRGRYIPPDPVASSIPFPLARPTTNNILAICQYNNLRPRYTKDKLPKYGYGNLHRQANAINQLESWFAVCCSNGTQDEEVTLCCAQQVWKKSLSTFCQEEFSIKTSHYHCCKLRGRGRWDCFENNAPNPSYQPSGHEVTTTVQGFDFNPSSCQNTSVSETPPTAERVAAPLNLNLGMQRVVIPDIPMTVGEEDFSCDYVSCHDSTRLSVPFPLARPTTTNILAICQYSYLRPRDFEEILPTSGFGHLHRQASAINQLESWYTVCCANGSQNYELILCCAQQAWKKSLSAFCENEFTIKTRHYHCCKENGPAKWDCFEKEASDTSYRPSTVQSFDFDPKSCQKISISEVAGSTMKESIININFPPGRPNSANIVPLCAFRKHRRRYLTRCLPHRDVDWLTHQLKAINGLEKEFGQCCKERKDIQACTEGKWKKMVDRFCKDEKKDQVNQFECCKKQKGEEQYNCFNNTAPNPHYMITSDYNHDEPRPVLDMFCDTYTALQKMNHLPFAVDKMAEKCCILVDDKRSACLQLQLDNLLDEACEGDNPLLAQVKRNCCKKTGKGRSKCITKLLLHNIAKAKGINKNRRICLIFS